jgi:PKD repeat protein
MKTKHTTTLIAAVFAVAITVSAVSLTANSQQTPDTTTQTAQVSQSLEDYDRDELTTIVQYLTNIASQLQVALQLREQTGRIPPGILAQIGQATQRVYTAFGLANTDQTTSSSADDNDELAVMEGRDDDGGGGSSGGGGDDDDDDDGGGGGSSGGGGSPPANDSPQASFTTSRDTLTVDFTSQSSDPDGSISSYSWDFGDNSTNTNTNPSHTYATSGTYTVQLTVTDDDGGTDTTSKSLTVSEADIVVDTLADATALTGVATGTTIKLRGRDEVNDGGGGLFEVTNSACETDGGTCFVFDEDLSDQQSHTVTQNRFTTIEDLPDSNLSWRSIKIRYGPNQDEFIPPMEFHGHHTKVKSTQWIYAKEGRVGPDDYGGVRGHQKRFGSQGLNYDWRIQYKFATSTRRLERMNVTNGLNVAWWGAQPTSEGYSDVSDEYTAEINTVANEAAQLAEENNNYDVAYVDFSDTYYRLYRTLMPDNVIFRGVGPKQTFENAVVRGGVRIPPGEIFWHELDNPSTAKLRHIGGEKSTFAHANYPSDEIGFKHFSIDGNRRNNGQIYSNSEAYGGVGNTSNMMQNGGFWGGFQSSKSGTSSDPGDDSWGYIEGLTFTLDNVSIRGVGANMLGNSMSSILLDANNVHTDRSQRNHHYYGLAGTTTNLVAEGQAWATTLKLGSRKNNESGNTAASHPRQGASGNWLSTYKNVEVKNLNDNNFGWGNVIEFQNTNVNMEDVTIDFRGGEIDGGLAFKGSSEGAKVDGVTLHIPSSGGSTLFKRSFYGPRTFQPYEITEFSDVTVHNAGEFNFIGPFQNDISTNNEFRDVTILDEATSSTSCSSDWCLAPLKGGLGNFSIISPPGAKRMHYENIDYNPPTKSIAWISAGNISSRLDAFPLDVFVKNSTFNNTGDWSALIRRQSDAQRKGYGDRVFMENTTFNIPTSSLSYDRFHYAFSPGDSVVNNTPAGDHVAKGGPVLRLRNCQTPNGRVSDESGTFTSTASDEGNDYVLIPTNLLSRARETELTLTNSGPNVSSITGWEVANQDGSFRPDDTRLEHDPYLKVNLDGSIGSGETVTIDWTARVTPLSEYRTTGLFQVRPVHDRTSGGAEGPLSSGNGPWEIDLRGTMATQETWTPPEYTATSGDTGVVTATVTENKHRDKQRAYTLELTEQGTGTTTIDITGSIPGVGTATTSFEVTVQ